MRRCATVVCLCFEIIHSRYFYQPSAMPVNLFLCTMALNLKLNKICGFERIIDYPLLLKMNFENLDKVVNQHIQALYCNFLS